MNLPRISYSPVREIVIHDAQEMTFEQLCRSMAHGFEPGALGRSLYWVDGVAFAYGSLPLSDEIVRDLLHGVSHVASLVYAQAESFQPLVEVEGSKVKITIWPGTDSMNLKALARWAKKRMRLK